MQLTQRLAEHIVRTEFSSLDDTTIERAKLRVLDVCGCALAGAEAPGCAAMLDLVAWWGGAPESAVLAHGIRVPAHNAAMMNSLMARSHDYEPVEAEAHGRTGPAHISGTTVPTALAVAEQQAADGERLLTALAIGDDIASRLGVCSGFDFTLGWDNTGTINVLGATAIACKLLRLDERQVFAALGIASGRLAGTMAGVFDKTLAYKLPIAFASREAITAASLAQRGYPGVADPFLGPRGYFAMYCRDHDADGVTEDLGKKFHADCVIKPYSACRMTHPFIDCALALAGERDLDPAQIEAITIHATERAAGSFVGSPFAHTDIEQPDGAFSLRYCVAAALLWRQVSPAQFTEDALRDARLRRLIDRTELVADVAPADARGADAGRDLEIEVTVTGGAVFKALGGGGTGGMSGSTLDAAGTKTKFLANAAFSGMVTPTAAEQALHVIERLEELRDASELTRLLVRDVA